MEEAGKEVYFNLSEQENVENAEAVSNQPLFISSHKHSFVSVRLSPEYTIMAESLERCFSRALLKHFPSEDGDTDEEFHIEREDRERKDKKRNRGSKSQGPESLIKATEQVQRKRSSQGGKGSGPSEDMDNKPTRLPPPPHWANGPPHPHSFHPGQQHMHDGGIRGMYHPRQQVSL